MEKEKLLFTPINLGTLQVKNRIAMPPMVSGRGHVDGKVTDSHIKWYEARAKGGVGLIVVEFAYVVRRGSGGPDLIGIYDDDLIPGLRSLVDKIHEYDCKICLQLAHGGRQSHGDRQTSVDFIGGVPVAPSAIACPLGEAISQTPHELTIEEIEEIVVQFGDAARRAKQAGFDGVEIHGAHGYLIAEFMSPHFNKRHDAYGGDLRDRMKFPVEIIKRIRSEVGPDFPVGFRFSGNEYMADGHTIEDGKRIGRILELARVDWLHVSAGGYESFWAIIPPYGTKQGFNVAAAAAIKEVVTIPVITVGRIKSPEIAEEILQEGKADMVALGRQLICDPDWPLKAASGDYSNIRPCIGCTQGCINRELTMAGSATCIYNPNAGMESETLIERAKQKKLVLVVGGGPGGLEAARVAALRGHQVMLFEKTGKPGGRFNLACVGPFKQEFSLAVKWLFNQMEQLGVHVELNTEVTPELVQKVHPDAVILATGARPTLPPIAGIDGNNVVLGEDILAGKTNMGHRVVVIGGGGIGTEVADFMSQQSKKVTIVEMQPEIGMLTGIPGIITQLLLPRLASNGVEIRTHATAKKIVEAGVVIDIDGREEIITPIDQVIIATGAKPVNDLAERLKGKVPEIYVIGDAKEARTALEATHEGAAAARII